MTNRPGSHYRVKCAERCEREERDREGRERRACGLVNTCKSLGNHNYLVLFLHLLSLPSLPSLYTQLLSCLHFLPCLPYHTFPPRFPYRTFSPRFHVLSYPVLLIRYGIFFIMSVPYLPSTPFLYSTIPAFFPPCFPSLPIPAVTLPVLTCLA